MEGQELNEIAKKAVAIGNLLEDGKGEDVVVLDVSALNSWTDYFVIATISSSTHWQGLYRQVKEYAAANNLEIHKTVQKTQQGNEWNLVDLGSIVVHLMSKDARDFYDLERLWHAGTKLKGN